MLTQIYLCKDGGTDYNSNPRYVAGPEVRWRKSQEALLRLEVGICSGAKHEGGNIMIP